MTLAVARLPTRLSGAEIRFLRKSLGLSGVHFADAIGATHETVSRWENDKKAISRHIERSLRLMVFNKKPATEYPPEKLATVGLKAPASPPPPVRFRDLPGKGWREARG